MKRMFLHCMAVLLMLSSVFSEAHGQWVQGNGIYGGTVTALAASANTVFAGTYKNGVFLTIDNGNTWLQKGLNGLDVQALAISGNIIYAGIYDDGTGAMVSGVYFSTDNGTTWSQTALNNTTVSDIAVNGNNVFAATDVGVFTSHNNGTSWTLSTLPEESFLSIEFSEGKLFAGSGSSGVWVSSNNGNTWLQTSLDEEVVYSIAVSGSNVFAGTYWSGVYRSTDFGVTWTQTDLNYQEVHALHIIGSNIFAGTIYDGVYLSSDNGLTWEQTSMWDKNVDALTSINNTLFAGLWGGGVYLTNDNGMNWSQTALNNDDVRAFISSGNDLFAGSASNGIYKSSDNGQNWTHQAIENIPVVAMGAHGNYLFAGCDYAGVYRSADNGETWTQSGLGIQSVYSFTSQNNAVFAGTLNVAGGGRVYKSTNNGGTWTQSIPLLSNRSFVSLAVSGTRIFAGSFYFNMNNMFDPTRYGIYISDDNGATWTQTTLNNKNVWSLAANGNTIFAGTFEIFSTGSGVFRSLDNGQTWEQTSLNDRNVLSLVVADDKVYAGTDNGIYLSEDNGVTWTPFNEGFGSSPEVYGLFADNDYLHAGTSTKSVWRRALSPQSSEAEITSFAFNTAENPSLPADVVGVINPATFSVILEVLENVNVSSLVATFTLSNLATASVGGVVQVSGVTANNFTNPVVYTITAEAGNTQNWTVTVNRLECEQPWDYLVTGKVHSISIPLTVAPEIFGTPLAAFDWIGVFFLNNNGEEVCGGAVQWNGKNSVVMNAYGDDPTTAEKDGFASGEAFRWRLQQCGNPQDYTAIATYHPDMPNQGNFANFGLSRLTSLKAAYLQGYSFTQGWNSISSQLIPFEPAVENMFSSIVNELTILRNLSTLYWPEEGLNTIGDWNNNSWYVLKVTGDVDFQIAGAEYVSGEITIPAGWSYLPVLSQCGADVMEMFGDHLNDVVIIQELIGTGVFWPLYNINTIQTFEPAKAYAIKMNNALTVSFPQCTKNTNAKVSTSSNSMETPWGKVDMTPSTQVTLLKPEATAEFSEGDVLGVFDQNGRVCGIMTINSTNKNQVITLFGDDMTTPGKDGLLNGEEVSYRLYQATTGNINPLEAEYSEELENTTGTFNAGSLAAIKSFKSGATGFEGTLISTTSIYPNPTSGKLNITGTSGATTVRIYDVFGQEIYFTLLTTSETLNVEQLSQGIYLVKINDDRGEYQQKLIKD